VITRVVIGAQYASGSRNKPATSNEATAAIAVRAECTRTAGLVQATPLLAVTMSLRIDMSGFAKNDWIVYRSSTFPAKCL
jgi:hypothetical protein